MLLPTASRSSADAASIAPWRRLERRVGDPLGAQPFRRPSSLLDIALRSGLPFEAIRDAADALVEAGYSSRPTGALSMDWARRTAARGLGR